MAVDSAVKWTGEGVMLSLVRTLGAEQLRALPPIRIPRAVLDAIDDAAKYEALCGLDDRVSTGHADADATGVTPDTVEAALSAVRGVEHTAIEGLRARLDRLESTPAAGPFQVGQWSLEGAGDLDAARELAEDAAAAHDGLVMVRATLDRVDSRAGAPDEAIPAARERVAELIDAIGQVLAQYHRFELRRAEGAMRARRADCELEARKYRELAEREAGIRAQLARRGRLIGLGPSKAERARLQDRLQRIRARRAEEHTLVDEGELRGWLDVVVDAACYLPNEQWDDGARPARHLLFQLLNVHCLQTVSASEDLAIDALLRPGAHERVEYCRSTEQYLGQYFARRRMNEGARVDAGLVQARDTLLREYRAHA